MCGRNIRTAGWATRSSGSFASPRMTARTNNGKNQQRQEQQRQEQTTARTKRSWLEAAEAEVVLDEEDEPEDGGGEEEGVDAVEDAAVAGKHGAGVFYSCAALDGGFEEVA